MKLRRLFSNWASAVQTFPVSHILLVVLTVLGVLRIEGIIDFDSPDLLFSLVFAFIISCYGPLFLIHSRLKSRNLINRILQIGCIILGGLYYLLLHNVDFDGLKYSEILLYLWTFPLALLGIFLIIALLHKKHEQEIWFSRTSLFLAIMFGGIAGTILRGGISGALASVEALFDVKIDSDLYSDIGVISMVLFAGSFIFNYYLILTKGINENSDFEINSSRLRRIFGSFIFLPLVLIYLAIFCAYGIKILVTGVWPNGIIVWLGIGYFALGIVTSYLIFPDKTKALEVINKILYISFILISFMMIGAIVKRINQYGVTINRCLVCYIIVFIIAFSILSLIFTKNRLFSFVSTLGILAFVAIYGWPINVYNISFNSQVSRLKALLSVENLSLPLTQGALKGVNDESTKLIMGALDGLVEDYNKDKIVNKVINYEYEKGYRYSRSQIREFLEVNNSSPAYYPVYKYRSYSQYGDENHSLDVTGYSKVLHFSEHYGASNDFILKIQVDDQEFRVDLSDYLDEFKVKADIYSKTELTEDEKEILRSPALELVEQNYKIIINNLSIQEKIESEGSVMSIQSAEGYILIK